ncbi:MAG: cyclodeaminase/cyclohydrolase family protein [Clostridia bacterium]
MEFKTLTIEAFTDILASKDAVPGGGGASALVGAVGIALGNMVGSLTIGKKKYADVEPEIIGLMTESAKLQAKLLTLMDEDAMAFSPLAKAYGLPKDTEDQRVEKAKIMETALRTATQVPLTIMEVCCQALDLIAVFAEKGSTLAISDAGVGATVCRAALEGASLNVFINTKSMQDRAYAETINARANQMLHNYVKQAEAIFDDVRGRFN